MIQSFKNRDTEKIWQRQYSKKLPKQIQRLARRKLIAINIANTLQDLKTPPGNRLEKLIRDRDGQYSIRINDQWRICFRWLDNDAYDLEIVDYH